MPPAQLDVTLDTIRARLKAEAPWTRQNGLLAYLDEQGRQHGFPKLLGLMDAPFTRVEAWAKANGIKPENITLGEFGMIRQEIRQCLCDAAAVSRRLCQGHDRARRGARLSWSIWVWRAFGIVDASTATRPSRMRMDAIRSLP